MGAPSKVNWATELSAIKTMGLEGKRMPDIAKHYGVSRQRIKQVLLRYIPDWHERYGGVVIKQKKAIKWKEKWGLKVDTDLYREQRTKFNRKRANATRVGFTWTIKFGDLEWPRYCPILGLELDYFAESRKEESPSFDRINNNLGYEKDNVIIISWRANRIKNDGTSSEHRKIADFLDKIKDMSCNLTKDML